jgi:hypothetical protein
MIKFENTEVVGWEHAIRGMRNPMNSWEKSDSGYCETNGPDNCSYCPHVKFCNASDGDIETKYIIGPNDYDLMKRLRNAGTDHRKFMRMIAVYVDITAPLYWWKEFDTYKVGTVANSCSTMHKIHNKRFEREDFSIEHMHNFEEEHWMVTMDNVIASLNVAREKYLETSKHLENDMELDEMLRLQKLKKCYWWQMIQLLPSSYNQKRTVMLNYEVLANIYESRKNHKLDEWSVGFMEWIESLPYSELICGPEFLRKKFNVKKGEDSDEI